MKQLTCVKMGCGTALIVVFLCILQCGQYQAENDKIKNPIITMRVPMKAVSNPPPFQKQKPPFPFYPQFISGCNTCRSSICTNICKKNKSNQLNLMLPDNPFWVSLPGANGQRTNIMIENPKRTESKQIVNVIVKVRNGNKTTVPSVATTANSTASKNKNGEQLTADTTADNVDVEVVVQNEGEEPVNTELKSEITENDDKGDKSDSKTDAKIYQIHIDKSPKPQNTDKSPSSGNSSIPNKDSKNPPSESNPTPDKAPKNQTPDSNPTPDKAPKNPPPDSNPTPDKAPKNPPSDSNPTPDKAPKNPPSDGNPTPAPNPNPTPSKNPDTPVDVPASPDKDSPAPKNPPKNEPSTDGEKPTDATASAGAASKATAGDDEAKSGSKSGAEAASGPSDK